MGYILKDHHLKGLKGVIRCWNMEVYRKPVDRKRRLVEQIEALDLKSELAGLSGGEVEVRRLLFDELWVVLKSIDASIFQRSRSRWLKEGDVNTKYFHSHIKARGRLNTIYALLTDSGWVEGPINVRHAMMSFFQQHFANDEWNRPTLDGVDFPILSDDCNSTLTAPFTIAEIEEVVKNCEGSKCPGPDGFNFAFIKEFLELMKHEVRIFFISSMAMIASLAKVLAVRLAKVIGNLIPMTQSAFLKGRHLIEGVVVVNVQRKGERINGIPTQEISIKRGLKQGDPQAPLLFLLVADGLGGLRRKAVEVNRFQPFWVGGGGASVSLIQYADDTLCIGEATIENLWVMKAMLRGFEMASGLKVNFWKSCVIGVNISDEFLGMASMFLNCRIGRTPFKYLGLLEVIQNLGSVSDGLWQWELEWRRVRFQWEEEQYREFVVIIAPFVPVDNRDSWLWFGDGINGFTVKSTYLTLENLVTNTRNLEPVEEFVFKRLWKCATPSKVRAFAWQLLLDRIPTKDNLVKRRMIHGDQLNCVLCGRRT
ncbi:hypothetical protein TSUD_265550 [Trifolium subterraneum]|uniref:Reverse transcriptase zinc-binding domain-containing protein n=1 Tax=Trifolium subterraneum TaxID=3900 RepID=A0A2Z6NZ62_TRISU|nr:hypothetical protein TSUD_265550 [Trifolium subterraneum]